MEKSLFENNLIAEQQVQEHQDKSSIAINNSDIIDKDDANNQGAIDPNTGEINWDCPCLKEAIAPPCGEYFKAAFSCFVKSQTNPKGEDCMDLFVAMQSCYMAHPEIYKPTAEDDESMESQDHNHSTSNVNTATIS